MLPLLCHIFYFYHGFFNGSCWYGLVVSDCCENGVSQSALLVILGRSCRPLLLRGVSWDFYTWLYHGSLLPILFSLSFQALPRLAWDWEINSSFDQNILLSTQLPPRKVQWVSSSGNPIRIGGGLTAGTIPLGQFNIYNSEILILFKPASYIII